MAAPSISTASSILGFRRLETFSFRPAATNTPVIWEAVGLPDGLTIETHNAQATTGVASTDVVSTTGHGFSDGDRVYFVTLTGGSGLSTATIYYVRDKTTDTYKLASVVGGAAINFTTDISAATIRKVSSGLITGSCETAGVYVVTLVATNMAAESGTRDFVIGISSEVASLATDAAGASTDVTIDIVTGEVTLAGLPGENSLATWQEGDTKFLSCRFVRLGEPVDPDPDTFRFLCKENETDGELLDLPDDNFEKIGSGASAYFNLPVPLTGNPLAGALSNYEAPTGTRFDALCQFEWVQEVTHLAAPLEITTSSRIFRITLERDLG